MESDNTRGNTLIVGVMAITILSLFGTVLVSRMITDSVASANRAVSSMAFYLADGGIQWGRRYLALGNTAATTLGPSNIGNGTVTVEIERTQVRYPTASFFNRRNVYRLTSTAVVGNTTRQIEELRYRTPTPGGIVDKEFMLWREAVADEF